MSITNNQYVIGNNIELLEQLEDGSIDLVYIDPPFATGRHFGDFDDKFDSLDMFTDEFLYDRINIIHKKLKSSGNLVVHCDCTASHYIKVMIDKVFGVKRFMNEVVWITTGCANALTKMYKSHDTILIYSKSSKYTFNHIYKPYGDEYRRKNNIKTDKRGEYVTCAIHNSQPDVIQRPNLRYTFKDMQKQWLVTEEKLNNLDKDDRLQYSSTGLPRIKRYLHEMKGVAIKDVWDDIPSLQSKEKLGYATQKPIRLLERIVFMYSNEGDTVLDCFAGSGTIGRACVKLNRNYILFDKNPKAKEVFEKSLSSIAVEKLQNETVDDFF